MITRTIVEMWTGTVDIAENLSHHTHPDGYRRTLGGFFIEGTLIIRDYGLMIFFSIMQY